MPFGCYLGAIYRWVPAILWAGGERAGRCEGLVGRAGCGGARKVVLVA